MTPPAKTAESLLAHAGWVRALAGALVRDPHVAEDLVQETWLAALQSRPRGDGPERGWLAAVLRNVLRQRVRGEGRRAAHEQRAGRADECESTLDVVTRAQDQRELVEAVLALDEPYRTTVLLRYFEELPPRAIAARRRLPLATVKSQLARGLAQLRTRLDQTYGGDGRAWALALAPLAPLTRTAGGGLGATGTGVLLVETKWKLAIAGVVVAGALTGTLALQSGERAALPAREDAGVAAAAMPAARPGESAPRAADTRREALPSSTPAEVPPAAVGTAPAAAPDVAPVRGRAFDDEGAPLAGVALRVAASADGARASADDLRVESGSGGWFELQLESDTGFAVADGAGRATVLAARVRRASAGAPPVVVVAPHAPLAGRVVDEAGVPVAGAHVSWSLTEDFRARFDVVLDDSVAPRRAASAADDGSFAFPNAPAVRDAQLTVRADGFEPLRQPAPMLADASLLLVLSRPAVDARSVVGRVVDVHGDPVEGAHVALGLDATTSDERGLFAFDLDAERSVTRALGLEPDRLLAIKPGFLPVERRAQRDDAGRPVWPTEVVLRLAGEPLAIAGRVMRADGSPAVGAFVWIADPSVFGEVERRPALAESLVAGDPGERWRRVEADADGRFELDSLCDRAYRVEAMDPRTLLRVGVDGVRAGAEHVSLVLSDEELYPRILGRLVSRHGAPVAGASVYPMCDALAARHGGRRLFTSHHRAAGTTTDGDGRFELEEVPRDLAYLRIDGDELIPLEYGRDVEGGLRELTGDRVLELEIVVPLRCHMRVEVAPESLADSLCVLDGGGERVVLNVYQGLSRHSSDTVPLSEGRSATLALSDAAETLVLLRGEEELERTPLALTAGDLNVVRP